MIKPRLGTNTYYDNRIINLKRMGNIKKKNEKSNSNKNIPAKRDEVKVVHFRRTENLKNNQPLTTRVSRN
jgi:hypothetical protein